MNPMYEEMFFPGSFKKRRPQSQYDSETVPVHNGGNDITTCTAFSRNHYQTELPAIHASHDRVALNLDPFDGQFDFFVQDILRSSEECFPEKPAHEVSSQQTRCLPTFTTSSSIDEADVIAESSTSELTVYSVSSDLEWSELEDPPVTCGADELPVAASLVQHVDLFASQTSTTVRPGKRGREVSEDEGSEEDVGEEEKSVDRSDSSLCPLEDQWTERFRELCEFKKQMGHCSVPHNYKGNPVLARWVKRQRHQYKQLKVDVCQGKHLPDIIKERVQALHDLGFVFDCQRTAWDEKLTELREYQDLHLDCNVPSNYPANPQLAMWVKCQRRQYKMLKVGRKSGMTQHRIKQLEEIGFTWELRRYNKKTRVN